MNIQAADLAPLFGPGSSPLPLTSIYCIVNYENTVMLILTPLSYYLSALPAFIYRRAVPPLEAGCSAFLPVAQDDSSSLGLFVRG